MKPKNLSEKKDIGVSAQVLKDLVLASIKLLTTHRLAYVDLAGFDIGLAA